MKTFKLSKLPLPAVLLITALSCKKSEISLLTQSEMMPSTQQTALSTNAQEFSSNAAIAYNYQSDIDLTAPGWDDINSCTGEHLHITSGIWHFDIHGLSSDHAFLFSIHNNTQNYKLVSLETGIEYTGNSVWDGHLNYPWSNPNSFTWVTTNSVLLTTSGGSNNSG